MADDTRRSVRGPEGDFALTFAEIGIILGIPQVTVQAIFTRAIRKLIAAGALKEFALDGGVQ